MDLSDLSALMGEDATAAAQAGIWVLPQAGTGGIQPSGAALLGEGRRLADGLGSYLHAVLTDANAASEAFALGADRVHVAASPVNYVAGQQPEFVLLPSASRAEAAALAQRLNAGLIDDARGPLSIDAATRALCASRPVYGGEYFLDLAVTTPVKMAAVDTSTLPEPDRSAARDGEVIVVVAADASGAGQPRVRDVGPADFTPPAWRPLSKSRVIVAAGRGVKDVEGFALVQTLAALLGADVAADRSVRGLGWIDEAREVGVTGQEVAPNLYLAIGIRGDTIHNAAIAGARVVVAIYPDSDAPIFTVADAAVVADPKAILPNLIEALRRG